ncbi:thyroid adenoma-associated protein homolog, partial [Mytilus californianus]|uniref:thyroid adenoma-associated protein homolog n=1 Tax=Mytilus californianus TaxID=6549 RepID=UPI002246CA0C
MERSEHSLEDILAPINTNDKLVLVDTYNYKHQSFPELIKRLEKLNSLVLNSNPDPDWIPSFIKCVISCYLQCTESIKLSRSVFKLAQKWYDSHSKIIEKEFDGFFFCLMQEGDNVKKQLMTVSNLLENNDYGRIFFEKHHTEVITWLDKRLKRILKTIPLSVKETEEIYIYSRIVLQMYQFCSSTFAVPVFDDRANEKSVQCIQLFQHLIQVLAEEKYAADCQFICGTAVSLLLEKHDDADTGRTIFWNIYRKIGLGEDLIIDVFSINKSQSEEDIPNKPTTGHIGIIKGMLSCGNKILQNGAFVLKCFHKIINFCRGPLSFHYHAFNSLEQLLSQVLQIVTVIKVLSADAELMSAIPKIVSETIDIVWLNWDSPVQDVPQIVIRIFSGMLQIWQHGYKHCGCHDIIPDLLSRLRNMSWYVKSQYRIISVLLSFMDSQLILDSDIRNRLLLCMSSNYLAPSGADVYKAFLIKMRSQGEFEEVWTSQWKRTIIEGLTSDNRLQRGNVGHYWISSTLKIIPEVKDSLTGTLTEMLEKDSIPRHLVLHAWVTVAQVVRLYTGDFPMDTGLLHESIYSNDDDIRSEAFSVLCSSLKKADRMKEEEIKLLKETIPYNLKIDSAPFRHQLSSNLKKLLVRIRDSYQAVIKDQDHSALDRSLEFVSWFYKLSIDNLTIGTCFQRRKTCLDFIQTTLEIFFPTKIELPLITQEARKRGLWDMYSHDSLLSVLHCILDGADEIQNLAAKLLLEYYPWPVTSLDACEGNVDLAESLLLSAFELCDRPKQHENRSGVLLCQLVFVKFIYEMHWLFSWCYESGEYTVLSIEKGDNSSCDKFLFSLFDHINQEIEESQSNLVKASISSPLHGFVSALTTCITELSKRQACSEKTEEIVESFIGLNCDIVTSMMDVMATESSQDSCPSFAELGQAMETLITTTETDYSETTTISLEHQYLLSWCWINIKECCYSLGCLCELLLKQKEQTDRLSIILRIRDVFIQVLTKCRHRGVTEGCRSSFVQFIGHLFTSDNADINCIPRQILSQAFHTLNTCTSSSVTRRSAGLPIIIQAVVTVEKKHKQNCLLQASIENLFRLSSEPLPLHYNDQHDLPQVHGLFILNALFKDSSLSAPLMPYTSRAVVLVIQSFESPAWSIRNAATMLFSSLGMRIFGQKKNTMEEVWRGITLLEFAALYPELPPMMNECVDRALEEDMNKIDSIKTSLFPVLTLLSYLGPSDQLNDETYITLGHNIYKFLSSPVLYLRNLAASAYVAFVPHQSLTETIQSIGQQISTAKCNQLHGLLCCLQNLAIQDIGKQHLSSIKQQLLENIFVITSPCG